MAKQLLEAIAELRRHSQRALRRVWTPSTFETRTLDSTNDERLDRVSATIDRPFSRAQGKKFELNEVKARVRDHWAATHLTWEPGEPGKALVHIRLRSLEVDTLAKYHSAPEGWINMPPAVCERILKRIGYKLIFFEGKPFHGSEKYAIQNKRGKYVGQIEFKPVRVGELRGEEGDLSAIHAILSNGTFPQEVQIRQRYVRDIVTALFGMPQIEPQAEAIAGPPPKLRLRTKTSRRPND